MSKSINNRSCSRRQFLKGAAGAAAMGAIYKPAQAANIGHVSRLNVTSATYLYEKKVPILCRMCAQTCPAFAIVDQGKVVRIENNPVNQYAKVCGRGRAGIGALYSQDRIKTPLIRDGERGEGKFRQASWDEALNKVAEKINGLKAKNSIEKLYYLYRYTSAPTYDKAFFHLLGTPNIIDYADTCWTSTVFAQNMIFGKGGAGAFTSDWGNAKYGVFIGKNPAGSVIGYGWSGLVSKAQLNAVPFTIVDPRRPSELGQAYAQWLPIRPGTDTAFLLSVMKYLVEHNKVNIKAIKQTTNADQLIDKHSMQPFGESKDYWVYDLKQNQVVQQSNAQEAALEGEFEYQNQTLVPAWQVWRDSLLALDENKLFAESGISKEQVQSVADRLADAMPHCFVELGYRFSRHSSDMRAQLAAIQLNLLLGTFNQKGGILANRNAALGGAPIQVPDPKAQSFTAWYQENRPDYWGLHGTSHRALVAKAFHEQMPKAPEMLFLWGNNLLGGAAGGNDIEMMLRKIPSIVGVSPFWNDTLMYADVILPDCTYLERDEPLGADFKTLVPVIGVHKKAIDPLFESKPGDWILAQLAKRVLSETEYQTYFADLEKNGFETFKQNQFAGVTGLSLLDKASFPQSLADLEAQGGWSGERGDTKLTSIAPTGRFELYSTQLAKIYKDYSQEKDESLRQHASPLNHQLPPLWLQQTRELGKDEFVPVTGFSPLGSFTGAQARNNGLLHFLQQEMHFSDVLMNRKRAEKLGLQSGDKVRLWSLDDKADEQIATLQLTEILHPDAIFSYYCGGNGRFGPKEKLHLAAQSGINVNQFGKMRSAPGVHTHTPQDVILKIEKVEA